MSRRKRRDRTDPVVKAVLTGSWRDTPEPAPETDAQILLSALADALNACEAGGVIVRLAHGAVLTRVGYILPIYPYAGERFAVRTMALTEFPVSSGDDPDD